MDQIKAEFTGVQVFCMPNPGAPEIVAQALEGGQVDGL